MTVMLRYPVCRATLTGKATCHRCGSDLSGILLLLRKAAKLRNAGRDHLLAGNFTEAAACFLDSLHLQNNRQARVGLLLSRKLLASPKHSPQPTTDKPAADERTDRIH